MKATVYIATSIDGYIARKDGRIDWLDAQDEKDHGEEDYGFYSFMEKVDCLVMGRNTFDFVKSVEPWPYEGKRLVVISKTLKEVPEKLKGKVELSSLEPLELYQKLETEGCKQLYIDGGKTVQSFIRANLIDDVIITRIPVLIGEGLPLFGAVSKDLDLELLGCQAFATGFVQVHYRVLK